MERTVTLKPRSQDEENQDFPKATVNLDSVKVAEPVTKIISHKSRDSSGSESIKGIKALF